MFVFCYYFPRDTDIQGLIPCSAFNFLLLTKDTDIHSHYLCLVFIFAHDTKLQSSDQHLFLSILSDTGIHSYITHKHASSLPEMQGYSQIVSIFCRHLPKIKIHTITLVLSVFCRYYSYNYIVAFSFLYAEIEIHISAPITCRHLPNIKKNTIILVLSVLCNDYSCNYTVAVVPLSRNRNTHQYQYFVVTYQTLDTYNYHSITCVLLLLQLQLYTLSIHNYSYTHFPFSPTVPYRSNRSTHCYITNKYTHISTNILSFARHIELS